jgi:hypothetical protein
VPLRVFLTAPTPAGLAKALGESATSSQPGEPEDGIDIDMLSDEEAAAMLTVLAGDGESA